MFTFGKGGGHSVNGVDSIAGMGTLPQAERLIANNKKNADHRKSKDFRLWLETPIDMKKPTFRLFIEVN